MKHILLFFSIKYNGDWNKIYSALERKEKVALKEIMNLEKEYANKKWITILDNNKYPRQFKEAYKPPFVFFYEGNLDLLKKDTVFISADKIDNPKEIKLVEDSIKTISQRNVIVNSLNNDVEKMLSKRTNQIAKKNIIVTHKSITNVNLNKNSLVISECPFENTNVEKDTTNRLIASLSNSLVLFNSSEKNHSKVISSFLNLGKEIYCFPKEKDNFNNKLIKQGANLITSPKEMLSKDLDIEKWN